MCAPRNDDFNFFYSVLAGLGLRDRTAKVADEVTAPGERQEWVCKTTFSRRTQRPLADFSEPPQSKRRKGLRRKSGVFCARSVSAGVVTRCFSPCLIFWCFWIKTKARKKESKRFFFRSILRETILPLRLCVSCKERIYHLLTPKGGAKSVRQAKSCGKLTAPR